FTSRTGDTVPAELGRLLVPENRADPRSRMIEIAFVRLRSTSPRPLEPIVYLDGGPGNSGISNAQAWRAPVFLALRQVADVIIPDYRSVGLSTPSLECGAVARSPLDRPLTYEARLARIREASRACVAEMRRKGVDLRGYQLNDGADDVDDIRRALGADRISIVGLSFGTTHATQVLRRHGAHVRRVVLAGLEGTDDAIKLPSRIEGIVATVDSLVRADTAAARVLPHGVAHAVRQVMERLERAPARVRFKPQGAADSATIVIGPYDFQWFAWTIFAADGLPRLPGLLRQALAGDYRSVGALAARLREESLNAMVFATDCASGASDARLRRVAAEERRFVFGTQPRIYYQDACDAWGRPDLGAAFRAPLRSNVPALFISGTLDARTPPVQAETAMRGFPASAHLVVEGAVHSTPLFLSTPEIMRDVVAFLRDGRLVSRRVRAPFSFVHPDRVPPL
ncbi:MAG TPA: alpha/beta fold hydrolase, partial [Longimicrobium sp.]|nr:alpha/beta fold hydrolase [Longimicrobium sp.]